MRDVHDLHASQIATGLPVLSAHVVVDDECCYDGHLPILLDNLQGCVAERFTVSVEHSTFQIEQASHVTQRPQGTTDGNNRGAISRDQHYWRCRGARRAAVRLSTAPGTTR